MRTPSLPLFAVAALFVGTAADLRPLRADPAPPRVESFELVLESVTVDGAPAPDQSAYQGTTRTFRAQAGRVAVLVGTDATFSGSSTEEYVHVTQ